tara:strand:- start:1391 stop:2857 length:1467 start_codon:yes stop_codon:yes gene_type:complete
MILLGLRLCEHDSNFTLYNNGLHYYKPEREYDIKHFAYNNLYSWQSEIKRVWNISAHEVDEIGIVIDPIKYGLKDTEFFPEQSFNLIDKKVTRVDHHYAHALSSWPVIHSWNVYNVCNNHVVIDGFGDNDNTWSIFKNNRLVERGNYKKFGSIGISMSEAANFLGIKSFNHMDLAGKLMALQAFGNQDSKYLKFLNKFDMYTIHEIFNFAHYVDFIGDEYVAHLKKLDWIKTVHDYLGEVILNFFKIHFKKNDWISYTGGVALNIIWNSKLKNYFKNLQIPPHCADEGLSIGIVEHLRIKNKLQKVSFTNYPFVQSDQKPKNSAKEVTIEQVANYLQEGKVVAWYQNHGEIGPRALGNRSLLINPMINNAKNKINKIKRRENYRPFGASVLKEHVNFSDPYMLFANYSNISSIEHIDQTSRVQTVEENTGLFRKLLEKFYEKTNCPYLLNTSLNINGRPIIGNVKKLQNYFNNSDIDILVIGDEIWKK